MSDRIKTAARLAGLVAFGAMLSACDKHIVTSSIPDDYRQRHPIHLVRDQETMEIYVGRSVASLDHRQAEDVRGFARGYVEKGEGPLVAYLPSGADPRAINAGLAGIRSALGGGGASGRLQIAHYHADQPGSAPIKLTYAVLKARIPGPCTYATGDMVPIRWQDSNSNAQPYNLGCSYQRNLAAQVADPRDFVRPRAEGPVDVERRTTGIQRIRKNEAQELKPGGKSLKTLTGE